MRVATSPITLCLCLFAAIAAADEEFDRRERAADDAAMTFLGELGGTLKRELADGRPADAIDVCSEEAPAIAGRISRENGWRVTRVGTRIRNPMLGMPDGWERGVLSEFERRAAAGEALMPMKFAEVVEESGKSYFRYMKAIGVQTACLGCHGSTDDIQQPVTAALATNYPHDRATGYAEGELRGAISIKQPMDVPIP